MKIAYAVDHENKRLYYDEEMKDILPSLNYKRVRMTSSSSSSTIKDKSLLLFVSGVDNALLSSNKWLGTHPNGLLLLPGVFFKTANASMGYVFQNFGITAWHNVMMASHTKGETPNVPMISHYDNKQWSVYIITRPAVFIGIIDMKGAKMMAMKLDYDVAIVETTHEYPYNHPAVLGKEVCAYGVISAIVKVDDNVITLASYLPSLPELRKDCPSLKVGMEVTLASAYSGIRRGDVISTNVEIAYYAEPFGIIIVKKGFSVNAPSMPGDSGGAVYIE